MSRHSALRRLVRACRIAPLVAASAAFASPARAASPDAAREAEAQALFDDARRLLSSGNVAEACKQFAASQRIDPGAGTLLNLGDCYERQGVLASAWATFKAAASAARRADRAEWVTIAEKRAELLAPRIPGVVLTLPPGVGAAQVTLDDQPLGAASLGSRIPLDPGEHRVRASAPGFAPFSLAFALREGEIRPIDVALVAASTKDVAPPAKDVAAPPPSAARPSLSWPGVAMASAGVVGLGLGAYFGAVALSKNSQAASSCPDPAACPDAAGPVLAGDARTARTESIVAFSVGGALAVGGAILIVTSLAHDSAPAVRPTAVIGRDGWRVGAVASF